MKNLILSSLFLLVFACAGENVDPKYRKQAFEQELKQQIQQAEEDFSWAHFNKPLRENSDINANYELLSFDFLYEAICYAKYKKIGFYEDMKIMNSFLMLSYTKMADFSYNITKYHCIYNITQGRCYINIPFGWGSYLIHSDSTLRQRFESEICSTKSSEIRMLFPQYEMLKELEKKQQYVNFRIKRIQENQLNVLETSKKKPLNSNKKIQIWSLKNDSLYYPYPVLKHHQGAKIRGILSGLSIKEEDLDILLRHLHNPCTLQPRDYVKVWQTYIEELVYDTNNLFLGIRPVLDTSFILDKSPNGDIYFGDVFERMTVEQLRNLELLYPDGKIEKCTAIADYVERRGARFVYFKRGKTLHEPVAYYFLLYYADYIPLWGWHLSDMEVVFPRRFLVWEKSH